MSDSFTRWLQTVGKISLRLAVIAFFGLFLARLLKALTSRLVQVSRSQARSGQLREQQTRTMAGLLYHIGSTIIVVIAILMALEVFDFNLAPAIATAGLASVAIAFGAQSLLKDVINGFFIVFEDQYVVGDLIQLNSEIGRVEHLTLRRTVIRNAAGAIVTVPNSLVGQVANLSRDWSQAFVDVTVPSEEMVGPAMAALEKVAADFRKDADWSAAIVDGPRVLGVESLSLDGIVVRLQVRTILNRKEDVAREMRRRIKMGFEEAGIPLTHMHKVTLQGEISQRTQ
ncbi:MAG: mechanosensitive ion channel family protein [Candidatus Acidiferrales bacterium]|jgi:small-conductance mechanosensitive channel